MKKDFDAVQFNKSGDHPLVVEIPEKYMDFIPVQNGAIGLFDPCIPEIRVFIFKGDWIVNNCEVYSNEEFNKLFEKVLDK
jgi:hypothetical protein